jgi:hypothetical protein
MHLLYSALPHPGVQGVESLNRHGAAALVQLLIDEQRRIEARFGHSDPSARRTRLAHVHHSSPSARS